MVLPCLLAGALPVEVVRPAEECREVVVPRVEACHPAGVREVVACLAAAVREAVLAGAESPAVVAPEAARASLAAVAPAVLAEQAYLREGKSPLAVVVTAAWAFHLVEDHLVALRVVACLAAGHLAVAFRVVVSREEVTRAQASQAALQVAPIPVVCPEVLRGTACLEGGFREVVVMGCRVALRVRAQQVARAAMAFPAAVPKADYPAAPVMDKVVVDPLAVPKVAQARAEELEALRQEGLQVAHLVALRREVVPVGLPDRPVLVRDQAAVPRRYSTKHLEISTASFSQADPKLHPAKDLAENCRGLAQAREAVRVGEHKLVAVQVVERKEAEAVNHLAKRAIHRADRTLQVVEVPCQEVAAVIQRADLRNLPKSLKISLQTSRHHLTMTYWRASCVKQQ